MSGKTNDHGNACRSMLVARRFATTQPAFAVATGPCGPNGGTARGDHRVFWAPAIEAFVSSLVREESKSKIGPCGGLFLGLPASLWGRGEMRSPNAEESSRREASRASRQSLMLSRPASVSTRALFLGGTIGAVGPAEAPCGSAARLSVAGNHNEGTCGIFSPDPSKGVLARRVQDYQTYETGLT